MVIEGRRQCERADALRRLRRFHSTWFEPNPAEEEVKALAEDRQRCRGVNRRIQPGPDMLPEQRPHVDRNARQHDRRPASAAWSSLSAAALQLHDTNCAA